MRLAVCMVGLAGWWPALALGQAAQSARGLSDNQTYTVQLTQAAPGRCTLEVQQDREPMWKLAACVGGPEDRYFVSNRGDRVWVLYVMPEVPAHHGRKVKDPQGDVPVAVQYDRTGQALKTKRLKDLVPRMLRPRVETFGKRFKWLGGVLGVPGVPPRPKGEQLELDTVGGQTVRLDF